MILYFKEVHKNEDAQTLDIDVVAADYPDLMFQYRGLKVLPAADEQLSVEFEVSTVQSNVSSNEYEDDFVDSLAKAVAQEIVESAISMGAME